MNKVSVIMPVYNAEKYLDESIQSVLKQTYTHLELILVNDCSADKSKIICEKYRDLDHRVILLENESEYHGPGPTRNIGMDHASGKYIYFMDADDWAEANLLQCAVGRMEETNADVVQFGARYEKNDGTNDPYIWCEDTLITKVDIKRNFMDYWSKNRNSLWMHLFRKKQIADLRFPDIIIGEDICFVMDALCAAERIAYISKPLYHYRIVDASTSHRWIPNTIECRKMIWEHQNHFLDSFSEKMEPLAYAEVAYDNYLWAVYQLSANNCTLSYKEKKKQLSKLGKEMEFDEYRNIYPLKLQHGVQKYKYYLVKRRLENILLLLGPVFLRIVRGE